MKTLCLFVITIGLSVSSCNDEEIERIMDYQQMQEQLLSHVRFENNRYVFDLSEQDLSDLNVNLSVYQEFVRKLQEANSALANVEAKGVGIIYADSLFLHENTNITIPKSRYMFPNYTTKGKVGPFTEFWGETQNMFCNALLVTASCDSAMWGVLVQTSFGDNVVLTGKYPGSSVQKSFSEMVYNLPAIVGASFNYLYGMAPISCSITPYLDMDIKIEEDPLSSLASTGITFSVQKMSSSYFSLRIHNGGIKNYWFSIQQLSGGVGYYTYELESNQTVMLSSLGIPSIYEIIVYEGNPNGLSGSYNEIGGVNIYTIK